MANKPTTIKEHIRYVEDVIKGIKNENMRRVGQEVIEKLKHETPNFPTDKKTAEAESKEFTEIVDKYFDVSLTKSAKKRPHKGG